MGRSYNLSLLKREFCKAIEKYVSEFQKWVIPVNFGQRFDFINLGNLSNEQSVSQIISQDISHISF